MKLTQRFVLGLILSMAAAYAQSSGTVRGLLLDPAGKSVPGAQVKLVNLGTQQSFETKTTDSGTYAFTFLAPGNYHLTAELTGFKRIARDVKVDVAGTVTIDATFELGETSQQVSVMSEAQQVDTSSTALGRVVEEKMLTAVPLSSRNFTQILALS